MNEVVNGVISAVIYELIDEFLGTNVQYHFIMVGPANFITDGLRKMGFTQAYPSVYHQWVERISPRFLRNGFPGPAGYPVTVTLYKYVKSINRIQLRIDLHFLQPGNHKRILHRIVDDQWEIHFVIRNRLI